MLSVDVAEPAAETVTLVGVRAVVGIAGEMLVDNATVPLNELRLLTVTVAVTDVPGFIVRVETLTVKLKSDT